MTNNNDVSLSAPEKAIIILDANNPPLAVGSSIGNANLNANFHEFEADPIEIFVSENRVATVQLEDKTFSNGIFNAPTLSFETISKFLLFCF